MVFLDIIEHNKHVMTGSKGNSEFCIHEAKPRGTLRVEGKQISLFSVGPVIKCLVIPPNSKIEQTKHLAGMTVKHYFLDADWHTILPRFQGVPPDYVRVESSSCCFPRELVSFVRHRELMSFDPWHVTRSPPIGKRI